MAQSPHEKRVSGNRPDAEPKDSPALNITLLEPGVFGTSFTDLKHDSC